MKSMSLFQYKVSLRADAMKTKGISAMFCAGLSVYVVLTGLPMSLVKAQEPAVNAGAARTLVDFETEAEMQAWGAGRIKAELSGNHATKGKSAMKVSVPADGNARFAHWATQDWSGFQQFAFDVFNAQDGTVKIVVHIWDVPGKGAYAKRFQTPLSIREGPNTIQLELTELKVNDKSRNIDISKIQQVVFQVTGLAEETVLHFDNFRLTGRFTDLPSKLFFAWNRYPGLFFYYRERPAHTIEMTVTYDRVTDPAALKLSFPQPKGRVSTIFKELARNEGKDFGNYEGLSLWVKGDGSAGHGMVVLGMESGPTASFPLTDTKWHRVDIPWDVFDRRVNTSSISILAFGLKSGSPRPAHYLIDRPQFVPKFADLGDEAELAEQANSARPKLEAKTPEPASLASRGNTLVNARKLLKSKKPINILCWGDSVTGGAQLWTVGDEEAQARARYRGQLQQHLIKHYGYEDIHVMGVTHGGYQARQAVRNLQKEVLDNKPDVVVLAFGAGDALYSDPETFKDCYPKMVERIRAAGIEIILFVPTPVQFRVATSDQIARFVREYGKRQNLATADINAGLMAQGEACLARWICDRAHPNQRAHEYMGRILFELFK